MSSLVDFQDLNLLDGNDLRAVFGQVSLEQVVIALVGVTPGFRRQLLGRLPSAPAAQIESRIATQDPVSLTAVQAAQRELVEVVCRLSRVGQVAFNDPEDMVA